MNANNSSSSTVAASPLGSADLRNQELTRVALESVETLRQRSISLLQSAGAAGVAAAEAMLNAVRAIWEAIMAILRFLARMFGVAQAKADKDVDTDGEDATKATVADKVSSQIKKVEASADEAKSQISNAPKAGVNEGNAFLQALQYAGLDGANAAMHGFVQDPQAFAQSKAPERMIEAALNQAAIAMESLDKKSFLAQQVRAESAAHFNGHFLPPLLVDDLIAQVRQVSKVDSLAESDKPAASTLLQADDALKAIVAHKKMIGETLALAAAAAKKAGAELAPHADLMERVAGPDWSEKVAEFLNHLAAKPDPTPGEPVAMGELSEQAQEAAAQAKSFLSGLTLKSQVPSVAVVATPAVPALTPGKPLTAKERLRQSAIAAQKAGLGPQEFPTDHSRHDDDDQNQP